MLTAAARGWQGKRKIRGRTPALSGEASRTYFLKHGGGADPLGYFCLALALVLALACGLPLAFVFGLPAAEGHRTQEAFLQFDIL